MTTSASHGAAGLGSKFVSAEQALAAIRPGSRVFLGTGCAAPRTLLATLEAMSPGPADLEFVSFVTTSALPERTASPTTRYRHRTFFVGSDVRDLAGSGRLDYVPICLEEVPKLLAAGRLPIDVALLQVSPPDARGFVSLGVSVDLAPAVLAVARHVIAEVNPAMPRTHGESFVHVDRFDALVSVDTPVTEYRHPPTGETAERVARYIAADHRRRLDPADRTRARAERGVALSHGPARPRHPQRRHHRRRRRSGGGRRHDRPPQDAPSRADRRQLLPGDAAALRFRTRQSAGRVPADRPGLRPAAVAANPRMVSITQAFAMDLTGQVCVDQFEGEFYGGVSTQAAFIRGAARSAGGKPIICLASTTEDGASRIKPLLAAGDGVGIARSDVHYVVTEYGIAYLFGKSIRERAVSLIEVAHPSYREELLAEAKRLGYVPPEQYPGLACRLPGA